MKRFGLAIAAVLCLSCGLWVANARGSDAPYQGSRYEEVWAQVTSDPYSTLPQQRVTVSSFFGFLSNRLKRAAKRTVSDRSDVLPRFQKLLHPNGTCLAGRWEITEPSPYTGYFREGSEALIIGRASAALSETTRGGLRAFGLAGKLYPTTDPAHVQPLQTANFFTIEDLGGTRTRHFVDADNTNDIIQITVRPSSIFQGPLAAVVAQAFLAADRTLDLTQTLIRQLYPIAELGEAPGAESRAPRWMKLVGSADTERVDAHDFRDELVMDAYQDGIRFDILVADEGSRLGDKEWEYLGVIHFTESVASDSCDHRLHFAHPRFRR